ncbi:MAG: hypothetical protein ABH884_00725 [Candidatus Komeilibacteria bacterium]
MQKFPTNFETVKPKQLSRVEVENILEVGQNLENLILTDLDLAGLDLAGKSFRNSDIRGLSLYRQEQDQEGQKVEIRTNIKGADFTDVICSDMGVEVFFGRVDAEGAKFGYTEDLITRRKRQAESGVKPNVKDNGGLFGFNGSEGNFRKTEWINIDFGGGFCYEAIFPRADLSEAVLVGCDLTEMDWTETLIDNIKIVDPTSLVGLRIRTEQVVTIIKALEFTDPVRQATFLQTQKEISPQECLVENFQINIVAKKE